MHFNGVNWRYVTSCCLLGSAMSDTEKTSALLTLPPNIDAGQKRNGGTGCTCF
jgi:hypothetical protein